MNQRKPIRGTNGETDQTLRGTTQPLKPLLRVLMVGGTFDDHGGKKSKISQEIFESIQDTISPSATGSSAATGSLDSAGSPAATGKTPSFDFTIQNGGQFSDLERRIGELVEGKDIVYWFPKISNDKEKLVRLIKHINQKSILVTSKDNASGAYSFGDLTYHALSNKSNLFIEFTRSDSQPDSQPDSRPGFQPGSRYLARVADPLGNVYLEATPDMKLVGRIAHARALEVSTYTRLGTWRLPSTQVHPIPDQDAFFSIARHYAETFHSLIQGREQNITRFFGNASFRCESGFPAFRGEKELLFSADKLLTHEPLTYKPLTNKPLIYVSKRNLDKRLIGRDGFVALAPYGDHFDPWNLLKNPPVSENIMYFGDDKPSVDTPIIEALFSFFPRLRYSLHGHVYISGAPFTKHLIPCGAVEEAREIIEMAGVGDIDDILNDKAHDQDHLGGWRQNCTKLAINLRGHGSLIMVEDLKDLEHIPYIPRQTPEFHPDYVTQWGITDGGMKP